MPKDHLIRMAGRIHRQLSQHSPASAVAWNQAVNELINRLHALDRNWQLSREALSRGWEAAAAKDEHILAEAVRIEQAASDLVRLQLKHRIEAHPVTLGTIVAELKQLRGEFEDVEIDLKEGLIGVITAPIVLEDIHLGPFSIDLHVGRLAERLGSECFNCVALEPNPAASREDTTHPHVQDGRLCAGDATLPISAAMQEGRIADAFVLVRSVLQTYNESSPYVALENWSGQSCEDCDYVADSDSMYFCDGCERDVCEDCYSICDICNEGCCRSCLETDRVSGNRCCSACRNTCSECDRTVDEESFDLESERCPECLKKQQANKEQETEHESVPTAVTAAIPGVPAAA